jgi:cell division protease FtsH
LNTFYKNLSMWLVIGLTMILLFNLFNKPQLQHVDISYSDFVNSVESGAISKVNIEGDQITGTLRGGNDFKTVTPDDSELIPMLRKNGVDISVKQKEDTPWYVTILVSWFPMLLLIGVWIFFMRQMQGGGKGAMSFGKTRARLMEKGETNVTFKDVAGIEEAKEELSEIIDFLKDPKKFTRLGARIPTGVLLAGAPGTGKTLLAKAIAGEAEVPFFTISGSDFVEMFVGVGASRVRDLFVQGKKNAPCIVFIDEIDAVGRHRGAGLGGGHDEREQTLNQLLVEMDGFESSEGVIIVAATNRPDVLDPALLRPGRFDRQVIVPVPDVKGREAILAVYGRKTAVADDIDWPVIARGTPGFTGADLENMVNEAALLAARSGGDKITMQHLEEAKDKVMMGAERRSMIITPKEKEITAYHEAGHALVAIMLADTDPIHKVTIIPRGRALGLTQQLPLEDKYTHSKGYLINRICILLGGRAAESLIFDDITTGAGNDIEQATILAKKMVCEWGMSDMGPLTYGRKEEQVFLGRDLGQQRDYSEDTAIQIDKEVRALVDSANNTAQKILADNLQILQDMAQALLDKETIVLEDIQNIIEAVKPGFTADMEQKAPDTDAQVVKEPLEEQVEEPVEEKAEEQAVVPDEQPVEEKAEEQAPEPESPESGSDDQPDKP